MIFDGVNDLLFSKWDDNFLQRMKSFSGQVSQSINLNASYYGTVLILYQELLTKQTRKLRH